MPLSVPGVVFVPNVGVASEVSGALNTGFALGKSFPLSPDWDMGVALRLTYGYLLSGFGDPLGGIISVQNGGSFMDNEMILATSLILDWGVSWDPPGPWSLGLAITGLPEWSIRSRYDSYWAFEAGDEASETVHLFPDPIVDLGAAWSPDLSRFPGRLRLYMDYRDVLSLWDPSVHVLLPFNIGLEMIFWNERLPLRFGFGDGLPSAGFGLHLGAFEWNLAIFGFELSTQPGIYSLVGVSTDLRFTF